MPIRATERCPQLPATTPVFWKLRLERPPTLLANVERTGALLFTVLLAKIAKMPAPRARESLHTKQQSSKMPRGSKPGERRGGRQRGTPNKSTVLKNAAITAAASDPNLSPLDFLLNLMRQRDLPVKYRVSVAHQALPFAHAKPKALRPPKHAYGDSQT